MEIAGKNDKVNKLNKNKRQMKDARNPPFVIGLMQIFEVYAEVSLTAQHSQYFPTQVWSEINTAKEKLQNLSEQWEWEDKELKLGQCGNPKVLVESIMTKHVYQPHVSDSEIRKNQSFLKAFHGVDPHLDIGRYGPENMFDEDDQIVIDLAGEMKVENITNQVKTDVEKSLMIICKDLLKAWDEMQAETKLQKAAIEAFGKPHIADPENLESFYRDRTYELSSIIETLPGSHKDKYEAVEMVDGFVAWNNYLSETDDDIPINKKWAAWLRRVGKMDDYSVFIEFFQCIQVRSMSEAMAETVGSLMNINSGTGRQLQPVNFSVEIYLRFNLGHLHALGGLVKDVAEKHGKEFFRREAPMGLSLESTSVAITSFRKKSELKCHIPFKIFE